jgi:lipopolysaccharide export system protein LptA
MKNTVRLLLSLLLLTMTASMVVGQGASIAMGTPDFDTGQPVEVSADTLSVDQSTGQAIFAGNVLVVQGQVRMTAGRVLVVYGSDASGAASGIDRLEADGGVTFVTATDAAEAEAAIYSVSGGTVTLSGDVLLTQGQNAISGDRLVIDLASGTGQVEGRVRTIFQTGNGN